jgi:hypothetical protein
MALKKNRFKERIEEKNAKIIWAFCLSLFNYMAVLRVNLREF